MYSYEQVMTSVEDLILDFIEFRKSRRTPQYKTQSLYSIDKGWTLSSIFDESEVNMDQEELVEQDEQEELNICTNYPLPLEHLCGDCPAHHQNDFEEDEITFIQNLCSPIAKILKPHVNKVLKDYEYKGSPVYDEYIDRETLAQMVDKVMSYAKNNLDEVDEIAVSETNHEPWSKLRLLRTIIEIHLLMNLYMEKRKTYRHECMY